MTSPIHYRYDTFSPRFVAAILDGFIVLTPSVLLEMLVGLASIFWLSLFFRILTSIAVRAYFILGHGFYGRTLGKKTQNLRVVDLTTERPISINQAFRRELLFIILTIIVLIISAWIDFSPNADEAAVSPLAYVALFLQLGFLMAEVVYCLNNPERRAIHDLIGGTIVVRDDVPLVSETNESSASSRTM